MAPENELTSAGVVARIRARRAELDAQSQAARLQYADLEGAIRQQQQSLALLQRNLDAMHGGLQELDALIAAIQQEEAGACAG